MILLVGTTILDLKNTAIFHWHLYAGLLLLSFMCFLATSVRLSYFMIIDLNSTVNTNHCDSILGVTAVLCLLVFVVPLMVLLLFYHLKIFQQCLTWCKLDRPGLHALMDAHQVKAALRTVQLIIKREGTLLVSTFCFNFVTLVLLFTIDHDHNAFISITY